MTPDPMTFPGELARLLGAEPGFAGEADAQDPVLTGTLDLDHPMAWRWLAACGAVEALTLVSPSPARLHDLPPWRDPDWSVETHESPDGGTLSLWWHAALGQAMLVSQIPFGELRPDTVARTLRLHREGVGACRHRWCAAAASPARPPDALPPAWGTVTGLGFA